MYRQSINADAQSIITDPAFWACTKSRTDYYPLTNAEFSAAGCIDAPSWIPAGSCGQWKHAPIHAGIIVVNREG